MLDKLMFYHDPHKRAKKIKKRNNKNKTIKLRVKLGTS